MPDSYVELAKCSIVEVTEAAVTLTYKGTNYVIPLSVIYPDDKDDLVAGTLAYVRVKGWFATAEKITTNDVTEY